MKTTDIKIAAGEVFYCVESRCYEEKPAGPCVKTCSRYWSKIIPRKSKEDFTIFGARTTPYGYIWYGWGGRFVKLKT